MTGSELAAAILETAANAPQGVWRVHSMHKATIRPDGAGRAKVEWRDDMGKWEFVVGPGLVRESDVVVVNKPFRDTFRFYHLREGEVVLTCQKEFTELQRRRQ